MNPSPRHDAELNELIGLLCNEALDAAGRQRLNEVLAGDAEAQRQYVRYVHLHAAVRQHAESLDDEDVALREAQAALDSLQAACSAELHDGERDASPANVGEAKVKTPAPTVIPIPGWFRQISSLRQKQMAWSAVAATALLGCFGLFGLQRLIGRSEQFPPQAANPEAEHGAELGPARLAGAVGARWAGPLLEIPEATQFTHGQRLELIEGLAEVGFLGGARVVMQGPAILQIRDENSASISVGRVTAVAPKSGSSFTLHTFVADLDCRDTEFGVEVEVDSSLKTQVFSGDVDMKFKRAAKSSSDVQLGAGEGLQVNALSGSVEPLSQPNGLQFVRFLPQHNILINLADVIAGGSGLADGPHQAYHSGISLLDGRLVENYDAPAQGDGQYHRAQGSGLVDGVFIPDGKQGPVQIDSIGRAFSGFPPTAANAWGAAIMARRPKEEKSLPLITLEIYGNHSGYVNWLHIAGKSEELSPEGHGLIGMHSNSGLTFDLHALRAQHPNKRAVRFRALVGNLESKFGAYPADAWVIVDGKLRYSRKGFSREDGLETIDLPLNDRDRFLVLAVTDAGDTAFDWVAFGDPVVEMTNLGDVSADVDLLPRPSKIGEDEQDLWSLPQQEADARSRQDASFDAG
jgi:hypothetical protein